jgi:hypothetical protein
MTEPPTEPLTGQDPDPPDVRLAVLATIRLLNDLHPILRREDHPDELLRLVALRSALTRLRRHLEHQHREEES